MDIRPPRDAPYIGGDGDGVNDGDGDTDEVDAQKALVARMHPRYPWVRTGCVGDVHHNSPVVVAVGDVLPQVAGEGTRKVSFPRDMDSVGSFDMRDVAVQLFLVEPNL